MSKNVSWFVKLTEISDENILTLLGLGSVEVLFPILKIIKLKTEKGRIKIENIPCVQKVNRFNNDVFNILKEMEIL